MKRLGYFEIAGKRYPLSFLWAQVRQLHRNSEVSQRWAKP